MQTDEHLVALATGGDRAGLTVLLRRHQPWVFTLAMYMLQSRADAEDATQEILLKITTGLASFRGAASFQTWARRVATYHLLDRRRSRAEEAVTGFGCFEAYLDAAPDQELEAGQWTPQERHLLVEEAARLCTMGMLLCLDRSQRMAFVLGEILELEDAAASDVLGISRDGFRQRLSRARKDLEHFLAGRCGLVDPKNPCRCARKTRTFIRDGIVDPSDLTFSAARIAAVGRDAGGHARNLVVLQHEARRELRSLFPAYEAPDVAARIRALIERPEHQEALEP